MKTRNEKMQWNQVHCEAVVVAFLAVFSTLGCDGDQNTFVDIPKASSADVPPTEKADECCMDPGSIAVCWWEDADNDGVTCNQDSDCPNNTECVKNDLPGLASPNGSGLCACDDASDCDEGICSENTGLCGPSYCNGYRICSCFGGCVDWESADYETPEELCAAVPGAGFCCDGVYSEMPGTNLKGYCSDDSGCGNGCQNDDECFDDNECTVDHCDVASGACINTISEGAPCGDVSTTDCSLPDTCDAAGTCQPNHLAAGTTCDEFDESIFPPSCYDGYCGEVLDADLLSFGDPNGVCVPIEHTAYNDSCDSLFSAGSLDQIQTGYLGSFTSDGTVLAGVDATTSGSGTLLLDASTLCATDGYLAGGDDCDNLGSGSPDLVYAFEYQTNSDDQFQLIGFQVQLEADFDAAVYVATGIEDVSDCPVGQVASDRCTMPFSDSPAPAPWQKNINVLGNGMTSQECCDPISEGASCGYKWCSRGAGIWDYPRAPVTCDDESSGATSCNLYSGYPVGNVAQAVVYPAGRNLDQDTTSDPMWKNVFVFVDAAAGSSGKFTLSVERLLWNAGPAERANDDPRVYDITEVEPTGSVYLGNLNSAVNSRHITGATSTCGGFDCAGDFDRTQCHEVAAADELWPGEEFFRIHRQAGQGSATYCITTDETVSGSSDLVLDVLTRSSNGSYKTIGPVTIDDPSTGSVEGKFESVVGCAHDNSGGTNASVEIDALEGALYLVGLSQFTKPAGLCTGDCNYQFKVEEGVCPPSIIEADCAEEPVTYIWDLGCPSWAQPGNFAFSGSMDVGGGTGGTDVGYGLISTECPDMTNTGATIYNGQDVHWLLNKVGDYSQFRVLVVARPGYPVWHPYLRMTGCTSWEIGVNNDHTLYSGANTGYQSHLSWMGVSDPYAGEALGWAVYTYTTAGFGWPWIINIDATDDPLPGEDRHYDIYLGWTP